MMKMNARLIIAIVIPTAVLMHPLIVAIITYVRWISALKENAPVFLRNATIITHVLMIGVMKPLENVILKLLTVMTTVYVPLITAIRVNAIMMKLNVMIATIVL
jgi:hypothetical protein